MKATDTIEAFHVTPASNVDSILANGLQPAIGARSRSLEALPAIYLFKTRDGLENALSNWLGDEFDEDEPLALISVRVPPEEIEDQSAFERVFLEAIPPSAITVVTRDIDTLTQSFWSPSPRIRL